jgi:hypothetical protein
MVGFIFKRKMPWCMVNMDESCCAGRYPENVLVAIGASCFVGRKEEIRSGTGIGLEAIGYNERT